VISSPQNPRIKFALKLRERRHRDREGLMLVEGADELGLALASGARPATVFMCPALFDASTSQQRLTDLQSQGSEIIEVAEPIFAKLAYRENPDGWLAVLPIRRQTLAELGARLDDSAASGYAPLLLVAEAVEKPGNLGALMRSADAAGISGIIVCDPRTDVYNPNVVRASKGTLFSVPLVEAESQAALDWLKGRGVSIMAATPQAKAVYSDMDLRGSLAIAVGTEKEGLSSLWLDQATHQVRIPMLGQVNSLNVATAATLLIYEALRQRTHKL
jgi:TrmH family RNA methyltransferase